MIIGLAALGFPFAIAFVGAFAYVLSLIAKPPAGRALQTPSNTGLHRGRLVACIGDSLTHGNIGVCWVEQLRRDFPDDRFINEGINGDVAWQLLQRLQPVLHCKPDHVVVLIGSNDAMGSFNASSGERYRKSNRLPQAPSVALYRTHLAELLDRLAQVPEVTVCTLPPVGELPDSPINHHVATFNEIIREIAASKNRALLDVSAAMWAQLGQRTYPATQDYEWKISVLGWRMISACFRHYVFKTAWDTVAKSRGQWLLFDHIHLGERAASVVRDLVASRLRR